MANLNFIACSSCPLSSEPNTTQALDPFHLANPWTKKVHHFSGSSNLFYSSLSSLAIKSTKTCPLMVKQGLYSIPNSLGSIGDLTNLSDKSRLRSICRESLDLSILSTRSFMVHVIGSKSL